MAQTSLAVYPGSFDPITNGHVDLVKRTLRIFDRVVMAIATNPDKHDSSLFTVEDRLKMIREVFKGAGERVRAETFQGLLVDYAERTGAKVIIRGLRAVSDFDAELQLAHNNRRLAPEVDTVFFMTAVEHGHVSSSLVKEIAQFGGNISEMVPPAVEEALRRAFGAP